MGQNGRRKTNDRLESWSRKLWRERWEKAVDARPSPRGTRRVIHGASNSSTDSRDLKAPSSPSCEQR